MCGPQCLNAVNGRFDMGAYTFRYDFISIPLLEEYGIRTPDFLHHHRQAQLIEHHIEVVPLGHPLFSR